MNDVRSDFQRPTRTPSMIENPKEFVEPLQLMYEEAFHLYRQGLLDLRDGDACIFLTFRFAHSQGPPLESVDSVFTLFTNHRSDFPYYYLAYNYLSNQGWCVRGGLKFGAVFVLYAGSVESHHAKFSSFSPSLPPLSLPLILTK